MAELLKPGKGKQGKAEAKVEADLKADLKAEVTQEELREFVRLLAEEKQFAAKMKDRKAEREGMEQGLIARFDAGAPTADGPLMANVTSSGARRPKWKAEFVAQLGQAAADEVEANTPKKITNHIEVVPRV